MPVIKAGKDKAENRATFEEACAALERGDVDAIGFVFTSRDKFTAIDLDEVINPETGEIEEWAAEIVEKFPTYWEISLSGSGLHGIAIGNKPGPRCGSKPIEIYDGRAEEGACRSSFMVMTGRMISPISEITDCQEHINTLYHERFPAPKKRAMKASDSTRPRAKPAPQPSAQSGGQGRILEPEELIQKASNCRNVHYRARFIKLFENGDHSGYETQSQADYALIRDLIYWCSGDPDYVEEMFRRSALFRPESEKHEGYIALSVRNCLASYKGRVYSRPKAIRQEPETKQRDVLAPYVSLLLDPSKWKGQKAASAYKAYAALILLALEEGISIESEELRIGADVRRLAERAGTNHVTLCRSSLPYLIQDLKLVKWRKGSGSKAGLFVITKPDLPAGATTKEVTRGVIFSGSTCGYALDSLTQLIRMRSGSSKTGKIKEPGKFETVARLGMVAMFCMVAMTATPRGLSIDELVEKTGRRKDHLRATTEKLIRAGLFEEPRTDYFTFAPMFWRSYQSALLKSGIIAAEHKQRQRHKQERRDHALKLAEGRNGRKEKKSLDSKVVDMAARRRARLDREQLRRQLMEQGDGSLTPQQLEEKLQEVMMEEYDAMVERCMQRFGESARATGRDRPTSRRNRPEVGGSLE